MSIEVTPLRHLQITEEAAGSFAQDVTDSATYLSVPYREGSESATISPNPLFPETVQQRIDGDAGAVEGPRFAELSFTSNLGAVGGSGAGDGVTSPAVEDAPHIQILKTIFGGADDENDGTDVTSGTSATVFDVASAGGFTKGGAFGWVRSDGRLEAREIAGVASSEITSRVALSGTPSSSDVIYAATSVYPTEDPDTSFQAKLMGAEEQDRFLLMGGQATGFQLALETGQIPTFTPSLRFADWAKAADAATPFDSGILPLASYSNFREVAFTDSEVIAVPVASSTRTILHAPAFAIESQLAYIPAPSVSGVNTVLRWRRNRVAPTFTVRFSTYFEDYTWVDAASSRAYYYVQVQIGSAPGNTVLLTIPRAQVISAIPNDTGGLRTIEVEMRATNDDDDTSALTRAVSRMHWL